MRKAWIVGLLLFVAVNALRVSPKLVSYVEPRIGTWGEAQGLGEMNPGPQVPFGCMRLGPDTSLGLEPFRIPHDNVAGYHYTDPYLDCLSHTHMVGAGDADLQNFGVIVTRDFNNDIIVNQNYRSQYTHTQETAIPGYYAVNLLRPNTYAEVAVSGTHAGIHRYTCRSTFPEPAKPCFLLFDICHSPGSTIGGGCIKAQVTSVTPNSDGSFALDAMIFNHGGKLSANGFNIYFHAELEAKDGNGTLVPLLANMWENNTVLNKMYVEPTGSHSLGVAFQSPPPATGGTIVFTVRAGISFVSQQNALLNLQKQQKNPQGAWLSLEDAAAQTSLEWETLLSRTVVSGGLNDTYHLTTFYSAMYRAHLVPTTYSESNGQYLGEDNKIHVVPAGHRYFSDLSLWDIYRTQTPMLVITAPDVSSDLCASMLQMYHAVDALPVWMLANQDNHDMVGRHSAVVFADAILKGVAGIQTQQVLDALVNGLATQNQQMAQYGYVPYEVSTSGSSLTLDYAIDAAATENVALMFGNTSVAKAFHPYSTAYLNVWDNATMYVFPRFANGTFYPVFPYSENYFTEGDAAEYRFYVPQDAANLVALFPSPDVFAQQLHDLFVLSELWIFNTTIANPAFWAGNEIDLQAPVLFNYAGNRYAYLTSQWFSATLDKFYTPYPSGLPGNDDYGTMSAWAWFGYLGLYPMASTDQYAIFAPLFDSIDVSISTAAKPFSPWRASLASGSTCILSIRAYGRPASGTAYLQSFKINGKSVNTTIVTQKQLISPKQGAVLLEFFLVGEPTVFNEPPPSKGGPQPFIPKVLDENKRKHLFNTIKRAKKV